MFVSRVSRSINAFPALIARNRINAQVPLFLAAAQRPRLTATRPAANGLRWSNDTPARSLSSSASPEASSNASSSASSDASSNASATIKPQTLEFKAETLKLLRIVTHSLYTDKEVFVRELISNASDALEKMRFLQATGKATVTQDPLSIKLSVDTDKRTVTITDSGVGMTYNELVENLGTIAKSGSSEFMENSNLSEREKANAIIGQFGVGFYSAFVVSDRVEVFTRSDSDCGYQWESNGLGTFTVTECPNLPRGTKVVCHLKEDSTDFASPSKLKSTAEKFSSFISFPISLTQPDNKEEKITTQEALWLKSDPTEEEHKEFFRYLSGQSWANPLYAMTYHTDAPLSIKSILYVPEDAPSRLFAKTASESGVSLHSRRVLVSKTSDLLIPRWMNFVKGVVDCEDMPMNISRESMQDTRLMEKLSTTIVKRFLKYLNDQSKRDAVKYQKFYRQYSQHLKEGFLEDLQKGGKHKDGLVSLLRFESSEQPIGKSVSLDDYISRSHPAQMNIYYFCASNRQTAMASPYLEQFKSRGIEVLLLTEDIDEFVAMHLGEYKDKKMISVDAVDDETMKKDLDVAGNKVKEPENTEPKVTLREEEKSELSDYLKSVLGKRVNDVKYSTRLGSSACVVSGFLPSSIRRMMKATMRESQGEEGEEGRSFSDLPATLELNPSHSLVTSLYHLKDKTPEVAELISQQLYDNACIAAGILDEPRNMLQRLNQILEVTASYAYYHEDQSSTEAQTEQDAKSRREEELGSQSPTAKATDDAQHAEMTSQ